MVIKMNNYSRSKMNLTSFFDEQSTKREAIDLLFGNSEGRGGLETKIPPRDLLASWKEELSAFEQKRKRCLLYP